MSDYAARQAARDREYAAAYDSAEVHQWIESLDPTERERLEKEGLLQPLIQKAGNGCLLNQDLADSPLAAQKPDVAESSQTDHQDDAGARADVLAAFCSRIRSAANPLLVFDAVCFATGVLALEGQSQTELAKRHGVSRAAFSKIATQWVRTFGIRPSRGMKSAKARKTYSDLTRAKWHERNHGKPGR
jgi:hypothetical protein